MATDFLAYEARAPRHEAVAAAQLNIEVQCESTPTEPLPAELVDLSRDGFQLCLPSRVAADELVIAHVRDANSSLQLHLTGQVRWQRKSDDGRWFVGFQSLQELDWETMGELFLNEILALE
jgi:hypothetical protein